MKDQKFQMKVRRTFQSLLLFGALLDHRRLLHFAEDGAEQIHFVRRSGSTSIDFKLKSNFDFKRLGSSADGLTISLVVRLLNSWNFGAVGH